jgi:hypothetical protein
LAEVGWLRVDGKFDLNLSDTFYYACADCEEVPVEQLGEVARLFKLYGFWGAVYWAAKRRGHDPWFLRVVGGSSW